MLLLLKNDKSNKTAQFFVGYLPTTTISQAER